MLEKVVHVSITLARNNKNRRKSLIFPHAHTKEENLNVGFSYNHQSDTDHETLRRKFLPYDCRLYRTKIKC